jgi:hypothetical protein
MQYTENEIEKAKAVAAKNARLYPKAPEGFWHNGIYIVSPFLDTTGQKQLGLNEAIACYGEDNVNRFISLAVKKYYTILVC